mmetsp:Transcript_30452/g.71536  ORF Transcript_30452/g.71536 Transcript_30452/m.71536 type:complete len:248 (-) Transcript_30452:314-1057(-)
MAWLVEGAGAKAFYVRVHGDDDAERDEELDDVERQEVGAAEIGVCAERVQHPEHTVHNESTPEELLLPEGEEVTGDGPPQRHEEKHSQKHSVGNQLKHIPRLNEHRRTRSLVRHFVKVSNAQHHLEVFEDESETKETLDHHRRAPVLEVAEEPDEHEGRIDDEKYDKHWAKGDLIQREVLAVGVEQHDLALGSHLETSLVRFILLIATIQQKQQILIQLLDLELHTQRPRWSLVRIRCDTFNLVTSS